MGLTVRKNITIASDSYEKINEFAKKRGLSFSAFLCETALKEVKNAEELSLLKFLNINSDYVSDEEQKEIEALNLDFSNTEGRELNLNELLQD